MTPIKPRNRLQLTQTVSKRFNVLKCAPFQARRTMLQPLQRARQIRYANAKPVNVAPRALKRPQSLQRPLLPSRQLASYVRLPIAPRLQRSALNMD
jgi:hypothetical protein